MVKQVGRVIEREISIGTTTFLVVVMQFASTNRYLVLDMDGQTVDVEPFMRYVENMIEELSKGY